MEQIGKTLLTKTHDNVTVILRAMPASYQFGECFEVETLECGQIRDILQTTYGPLAYRWFQRHAHNIALWS